MIEGQSNDDESACKSLKNIQMRIKLLKIIMEQPNED
jgi:hypothetical protein